VEAFCAEHKVDIDEVLYDWPASKFESLYDAFSRRKVAEELTLRRALEVAAVWGNTNMDSKESPELRQKFQKEIEENFTRAIASLYGDGSSAASEPVADYDKDDQFFAAMERGMEKRKLPKADKLEQ
jgi:hypothetical protein